MVSFCSLISKFSQPFTNPSEIVPSITNYYYYYHYDYFYHYYFEWFFYISVEMELFLTLKLYLHISELLYITSWMVWNGKKILTIKLCTHAKLIIYIKMDLALNNLQGLICNKTKQTNKQTNKLTNKWMMLNCYCYIVITGTIQRPANKWVLLV